MFFRYTAFEADEWIQYIRSKPVTAQDLLGAALDKTVSEVQKILDAGIDVDACDATARETALMVASGGGNMEVVRYLIERGADINAKSCEGSTAIMPAVHRNRADIVGLLISKGAKVNYAIETGYKFTPLQLACQLGHVEIVKCLLDAGARVNVTATDGSTPLISAAFKGHHDVVQMLLDKGANPTQRAANGMTAREFADQFRHAEVQRVFDAYVPPKGAGKGCLVFLVAPVIGVIVVRLAMSM